MLVRVLNRTAKACLSPFLLPGVGVQPANNNTQTPPGASYINGAALRGLDEARKNTLKARLATSALIDVQACGSDTDESDGQELATNLQRNVRFAIGSVGGWNQGTPGSEKYGEKYVEGKWVTKTPQ